LCYTASLKRVLEKEKNSIGLSLKYHAFRCDQIAPVLGAYHLKTPLGHVAELRHIGLHKRQPRFAYPAAFIDLSRSATAYFGNSSRSFFSRWTSVVNCSGSCFARSS
jgi:hypothetical protein